MPHVVARVIPLVVVLFALVESACDDKPTPPHVYSPYPQQLYDLSADSHYVYFRDDGTAFGRPAGIYRFPLEGKPVVEPVVVHPSAYFPRISPSGRLLAFVDLANALIIRELDSGRDSVLLRADVVDIDWYSEDTLVCEIYACQIILVAVRSGESRTIQGENGCHPSVSRSGVVAFIKHLPYVTLDSSILCFTTLNGDVLFEPVVFRDEFLYGPDLSDDGHALVLVRDFLEGPRLAMVGLPGEQLRDSIVMFAADPFFTSDDRILYINLGDKSRGQKDEIRIMPSDSEGQERLLLRR